MVDKGVRERFVESFNELGEDVAGSVSRLIYPGRGFVQRLMLCGAELCRATSASGRPAGGQDPGFWTADSDARRRSGVTAQVRVTQTGRPPARVLVPGIASEDQSPQRNF